MNWRIYRLPGSREIWHIDSGPGTQIFNVRAFTSGVTARSVDIGGSNVPRAWIEIPMDGSEFHIVDGVAQFEQKSYPVQIPETEISELS